MSFSHSFEMMDHYDVLVAGTGLAGIKAAVTCADSGQSVLLITSSILCSGSSFYPLMDTLHCLCTSGPEDEDVFYGDIESCSYSMNDPYMSRYYITHIRQCIEELPDMGITYEKLPEKKLACFGHTERDLYYWKNWDLLREGVSKAIQRRPSITLSEHTSLSCILTSDHHGKKQISGAVLQKQGGTLFTVGAKSLILACGGLGSLYLHNLNTAEVDGSAHSLALTAGAGLINLEFNQFIPGFVRPLYKTVFREGTLRYCTGLTDSQGQDALRQLLPQSSDYDRCLLLREPHGPFTSTDDSKYFDIALMKSAFSNLEKNGGIFDEHIGCRIHYSADIAHDDRLHVQDYLTWLQEEHNITLAEDPVLIAPFFHAANGGIQVDHHCQTDIAGLFACGESAGGIHGADRLGGMASGSCLVFGKLAGESASAYAAQAFPAPLTAEDVKNQLKAACTPSEQALNIPVPDSSWLPPVSSVTPAAVIRRVRELMWQYANVIRTEDGLSRAKLEISHLSQSLRESMGEDACFTAPDTQVYCKACQFINLSLAMLTAMQNRRESRGGHYREDYPLMDENCKYRISIKKEEDGYSVIKLPVS